MATETIKVPDLGDTKEVEVIELLVSVGQTVAENDSLLVLESDKAAMEIPAPMGGVVKSIAVNLGDQVKTGSEILTLEVEGKSASKPAGAGEAKTPEKPSAEPAQKADKAPAAGPAAAAVPAKESQPKVVEAAVSAAAPGVETILIPDLGGEQEVEVIEVHVKPGDSIKVDDPLVTLESDKAAMDVPSTLAGEVKSVALKVGDKVAKGRPVLELLVATAKPAVEPAPTAPAPSREAAKPAVATAPAPANQAATPDASQAAGAQVYAGPAVRKLARELGVNLAQVAGTGARGRILKEDINEFVKTRINTPAAAGGVALPAVADIDFSQFGEVEQVSMSKLQRTTAVNMLRNWSSVPHVAQFNEADVTDLEAFREQQKAAADKKGVKLTFLPFLLKACAKALQEYPQFNVSLHSGGEYYFRKKYYHVGVAVATEAGLVVPVVRNVDQKSIWELAGELAELSEKARQRRLAKEDMQGACFTISSLGALGGTGFIPIINAPEVAILGVGKTDYKPVYQDGSFVARKMLPLTLSYDHRALNGVDGGNFSTYLVRLLGDIRLLLL